MLRDALATAGRIVGPNSGGSGPSGGGLGSGGFTEIAAPKDGGSGPWGGGVSGGFDNFVEPGIDISTTGVSTVMPHLVDVASAIPL